MEKKEKKPAKAQSKASAKSVSKKREDKAKGGKK